MSESGARGQICGHPYLRKKHLRVCRGCKTEGALLKILNKEGGPLYLCDPCRSIYIARLNLAKIKESTDGT